MNSGGKRGKPIAVNVNIWKWKCKKHRNIQGYAQ